MVRFKRKGNGKLGKAAESEPRPVAGRTTVIVIFGCRHEKEYVARADRAFRWALENRVKPVFIFTGNDPLPPNRIISFFGSNRIIWENKSKTTKENVNNVLVITEKYWISDLERMWVSSWYHIQRIKLLLRQEKANVSRETFVSSYSDIAPVSVFIEPFAYLAAYFGFNHWLAITRLKRILGYNV